jgi:hypothetical protein
MNQWLESEYIDEKRSLKQLGEILCCGPNTVRRRLIKMEVKLRGVNEANTHNIRQLNVQKILETEYKQTTISQKELATKIGCSVKLTRELLKENNIRIRTSGEQIRGIQKSKESIEKRREKMKLHGSVKGNRNPNWRGGKSFEPYCEKFNDELKTRIRNKFDNKCVLDDTEINIGNLHVHHADYNKGQGCGKEWSLVTLCRKHHTKTNFNRWYWFNLLQNYWVYEYTEYKLWVVM